MLAAFAQHAFEAQSALEIIQAFEKFIGSCLPGSRFVPNADVNKLIAEKTGNQDQITGPASPDTITKTVEIGLEGEKRSLGTLYIEGANVKELESKQAGLTTAIHILALALDREGLRQSVAEQERRFQIALDAAGMGVWAYRPGSERMEWDSRQYDVLGWPRDAKPPTWKSFLCCIPQEDRENLERAAAAALSHSEPLAVQFRFKGEGGRERWMAARGACFADEKGAFLTGVNFDVTRRHRSEERLRILIGELNHRVKNILASIGAIAGQSMKNGESLENYVEHLRGRIRAFANVHEILSRSNWDGVPLRDLIHAEIQAASAGGTAQVGLDGPAALLKPRAGQMLGLAFHELAINSAKFGALAADRGHLSIRWQYTPQKEGPLLIDWVESAAAGSKRLERGFGSVVVEELLTQELDAKARYDFSGTEVRCSIELPSEWVVGR